MPIMVEMPSALRQFANNQDELSSEGKTVEDVFLGLCREHPELKQNLYGEDGKIRSFLNIYINDEDIRYGDGMASLLKDGDRIQIVPSIAGGVVKENLFSSGRNH